MRMDLDAVTARWQRRYGMVRFALWMQEFTVQDMAPGSIVYDRLRLAVACQRFRHALRAHPIIGVVVR